jgi:tetratricopeptide (TPR) repeat protein
MRLAILTLVAACYAPTASRREQSVVADNAHEVLAQALPPPKTTGEAPDHAAFDHHYRIAMDAYRRAEYATAVAEFEAAYAIDSQPLLIFNIAQSYRRAGQLPEALREYRRYLGLDPGAERDHVRELIEQTEHELAQKPVQR